MRTVEPLVSDPSPSEVKIATAKLKRKRSPGGYRIPAELIQAGGETLSSGIHKPINSISNKAELPWQWKESIIVPIYKKCDRTECSNYQLHTKLYQHPSLRLKYACRRNYRGSSVWVST
jgi:hypothetical protein